MLQLTDNFILEEFIPKEVYTRFGEMSIRYINPKLPILAQGLRDFFKKPVTINNWKWGGDRNYSGLRTPDSKDYKQFSDHSFGNAIDFIVKGEESKIVQKLILDYDDIFLGLGVRIMEKDTNGWTHLSVAHTGNYRIKLIGG